MLPERIHSAVSWSNKSKIKTNYFKSKKHLLICTYTFSSNQEKNILKERSKFQIILSIFFFIYTAAVENKNTKYTIYIATANEQM